MPVSEYRLILSFAFAYMQVAPELKPTRWSVLPRKKENPTEHSSSIVRGAAWVIKLPHFRITFPFTI